MANPNKIIKFEIESANGTMVDVSKYIKSVQGPLPITEIDVCPVCFKERPTGWVKRFLFRFHKCEKLYLPGISNITIKIEKPKITRRYNWWKWN